MPLVQAEEHQHLVTVVSSGQAKGARPTAHLLPAAGLVEALQPLPRTKLEMQLLEGKLLARVPGGFLHDRPANASTSIRERRLHPGDPGPMRRELAAVPLESKPSHQRILVQSNEEPPALGVERFDEAFGRSRNFITGHRHERESNSAPSIGYRVSHVRCSAPGPPPWSGRQMVGRVGRAGHWTRRPCSPPSRPTPA